MEYFPAVDEEQLNYIKTIIDESDYYVTILAGKYGSLAPDGLSYSEKEYNYAVQSSIPVIALIHQNVSMLEASKRESDIRKIEMLERFRSRLCTGRLVAFWENETDLCLNLIDSLNTTAKKYPRNGWIRGAKENPEDLLRRIGELEDANQKLKGTLQVTVDAPIVDHIRSLLNKMNVEIDYKYSASAGNTTEEQKLSTTLLEIAQYVIPRMAYDPREDSYTQVSHEYVEGTIKKFVSERTGRAVVFISESTVDDFIYSIEKLGLLTSTIGFQGRKSVIVASPGGQLVRDQTLAMRKLVT